MGEFDDEPKFENALIHLLTHDKGWDKKVLKNYTEEQLIQNWADILYKNNRSIDRLGDYPLTDGEMQQLIDQINELRTPFNLNGFINGKTVSITRDNQDDKLHFGKEISLKIYDRSEIAGGQSTYQIVEQPKFHTQDRLKSNRRGDFMLLINGMPVFHVELKKSGIPVSQATNQIEKYSHEGIFQRGIYALVQVFVAMTPEEMVYFANPGFSGTFDPDYYFHWADFYNEPVNNWKQIAEQFLSIPMAHQIIGFYTVADGSDAKLKVMRPYQIYAARKISQKIAKIDTEGWANVNQLGGYIFHTTGSGKTLTSFKSAQLIQDSGNADKVIFLVDRIELDTQSTRYYREYADDPDDVQDTDKTSVLLSKLANDDDILIATSIQKMNRIIPDETNKAQIRKILAKRIVIILDECHRDTFGEMLIHIKHTFTNAVFFGCTGTPITDNNKKKWLTTSDLFGEELHRYSIADGIRDKNVLPFDPYKVSTYDDNELRKAVALHKAKADSIEEALGDPQKKDTYLYYMNKVHMAGWKDAAGDYHKGIEDYIPSSQYNNDLHRREVVKDIKNKWIQLSLNNKYHALLATSNIPEAIAYYKLLREEFSELKVTCLFDPTIDNNGGGEYKEDAIAAILDNYNQLFHTNFNIPTYRAFKNDVSARVAHKDAYRDCKPEEQLNLLIVVNQMLTGYDSNWLNTLYLDKVMVYEQLVQAFSRTNRLAGPDKPFGIIRYYRKVNTMERNVKEAIALYSGNKPFAVFVSKLPENLRKMNEHFLAIKEIFKHAGIKDFASLPGDKAERGLFANHFHKLSDHFEAARLQDFSWNKLTWTFDGKKLKVLCDEPTYYVLLQRYKELFSSVGGGSGEPDDPPYDIDTHLTEMSTGKINTDYMNSRFTKYVKALQGNNPSKYVQGTLDELHRSFASLHKEEQKFANIILDDFTSGKLVLEEGKTLRDYITEYQHKAKNDQIHKFCSAIGADESKIHLLMESVSSERDLNAFGRFDDLKKSVDRAKAKAFIENLERKMISPRKVNQKLDEILRKFILKGGLDISDNTNSWHVINSVEEDSKVKAFIDFHMSEPGGTTIEKLWTACQHEYGEKYGGTTSQQWYHLIKDYVQSKTHRYEISDTELFYWDKAAEPLGDE